ncbi:hypothetical protein SGRA_2776 [Saprospira grandis str. Lewin]|uniref:Uncharacterized protein n=1 Tax=Saprospira grandis (strain Lewin) TaxID=984262 RepID=H6LA36_SAPGL|nr:hypothetical protein SGRA_2776 [Saprospira grandis str. Lewin]
MLCLIDEKKALKAHKSIYFIPIFRVVFPNRFKIKKVLFLLLLFWGCPALRAGRAVSQLAGLLGPAGFFASLQKPWVCRLQRPCFPSLSRPRFAPLWRQAASPSGALPSL